MAREDIIVLGREIQNGTPGPPIGIPVGSSVRHILVTGETGSGKTTTATKAITTAQPHTDGPTLVIDSKGAGWATGIARAHFARTGTLDDVIYFDAARALPALSVFDLRRDLSAGFDRGHIIENLSDRFLNLVAHAKPGGFETIRSQDVIRYLIMALADPVHGNDAFTLDALVTAIRQLHKSRTLPEVSTAYGEDLLEDLTLGQKRTVDNIIDGALTRVEKFYSNSYLRPLFNHVPVDQSDAFVFDEWLDRDVLILIDISEPEPRTQRILANLLLEQFWRALGRRKKASQQSDLAQALVFVDEVANLRIDATLAKYLSMGREFGVGIVPMLQNPKQLDTGGASAANAETDARTEILNNCHTIVAGAVTGDDLLINKLSGDHMSQAEVRNRLNNLSQDRWFFRPAGTRDTGAVQSFIIAEPPLPPGHPEGPDPLSPAQQEDFEAALEACRERTRNTYGIEPDSYDVNTETAPRTSPGATIDPPSDALRTALSRSGFMTTLPLVDTLPGTATYEPAANALVCATCGATRPATFDGLRETLACHGTLAAVDRASIPPVELGVTLTADERAAAPVDLRLLCALQIIANIARRRYDPLEIDLVHDSPHEVLGLFGIDSNDIQQLKQAGLITVDKLRGYSYYTVTKAGRDLLQEPHRKGVEWGHGTSDNTETLLHIVMVEALCRYVTQHYCEDPESPIVEAIPYFELGEGSGTGTDQVPLDAGTRFDVVGLDTDGHIRLIGEAERHNNDAATAAVADYDKIATVAPDHALWVVPSSAEGHDAVLSPLADPEDGSPRIDAYSEQTRIPSISGVDEPGMTDIVTLNELRKQLAPPSLTADGAQE